MVMGEGISNFLCNGRRGLECDRYKQLQQVDGVGHLTFAPLSFFIRKKWILFALFHNPQKGRIFILRFSDHYRDLGSLKVPLTVAHTQHPFLGE